MDSAVSLLDIRLIKLITNMDDNCNKMIKDNAHSMKRVYLKIAQAQRTGAQASIMKSLQRENNFKNSVKARTILCDKQQTRQRFLVAEKRGKEGEAFRQLTLG